MNILLTYIPFQILLGVIFGILFPCSNQIIVYSSIILIGLSFGLIHQFYRKNHHLSSVYFVLIVIFGILSSWFFQNLNRPDDKLHEKFLNREIYLEIVLKKTLRFTKDHRRFYAEVNRIDGLKKGNFSTEVLLKNSEKNVKLKIGDVLFCKSILSEISHPISPYDFDYRKYLSKKNVVAKMYLSDNFLKSGSEKNLVIQLQNYRDEIVGNLSKSSLDLETQSLIKALILGDKEDVSDEIFQSFKKAGVIHIIAISGMHIGILYLLLAFLFGFVKKYRYGDYIFIVLMLSFLWGFAIFSGMSTSVIRSVIMFSFFVLSRLKRGKTCVMESIVCSILLLLLIDANFLFDIGFQLSYTAVISIVVFHPICFKYFSVKNRIVNYCIDIILISFIAQIGVFPLSLYYFHQIPIHFLLSNFFTVSLLPIVLYGGILILLKGMIFNFFSFFDKIYNVFIRFYLDVISYFSSFDQFILEDLYFKEIEIVFYYLVFFSIWFLFNRLCLRRVRIVFFLLILVQISMVYISYFSKRRLELIVYNLHKNLVFTIKDGDTLFVFDKVKNEKFLKENRIKNRIKKLIFTDQKIFSFRKETYLVVNEDLPYEKLNLEGIIGILPEDSKVDLERFILNTKPKNIVALASNYQDLKWKNTCKKLGISFHDIRKEGAYFVR